MNKRVRTRFAPSPTGFLHVGGLRTALYAELLARHHDGDFILRIEDTDRARLVSGATEKLCQSLQRCGVIPNEGVWVDESGNLTERGLVGPYVQSERKERHRGYAEELVDRDFAYYCFCTTERLEELRKTQEESKLPTMYDRRCRDLSTHEARERIARQEPYVIRMKTPLTGSVSFVDLIRGEVTFDWSVIDDQVLLKSDGYPTYFLANTCDDHDQGITHITFGEEWISSAPKRLFLYDSFGWERPQIAHLPLLLNPDRSKLSKRQGDVAVEDYLAKGYLPEALVNFVALLGWNPTADREIYTKQELIDMFDITKVNKSGAVFNHEKLDWLNAQYLKKMPVEEYLTLVRPLLAGKTADEAFRDRCALLVRDRLVLHPEIVALTEEFFVEHHDYSKVSLVWKTQPAAEARERLEAVLQLLQTMPDEDVAQISVVETQIKQLIAQKGWGNGDTLWPLRVSLSGAAKSPGPFELIATYGKERAVKRIEDALAFLKPL